MNLTIEKIKVEPIAKKKEKVKYTYVAIGDNIQYAVVTTYKSRKKALKRFFYDTSVLILSGYAQTENVTTLLLRGAFTQEQVQEKGLFKKYGDFYHPDCLCKWNKIESFNWKYDVKVPYLATIEMLEAPLGYRLLMFNKKHVARHLNHQLKSLNVTTIFKEHEDVDTLRPYSIIELMKTRRTEEATNHDNELTKKEV